MGASVAGSSLLLLIDDVATLLDDVATMSKVATGKTAGVLGDDLALNAQQVTGVRAERELPVVWAVAKGSLLNKVVLVPLALLISALAPQAIVPLLMLGGTYLCFEGAEKWLHAWHAKAADGASHQALIAAAHDPAVDLVAFEKDRIKGAVRTDFVLSAEIIAIALGTVAGEPLLSQALVLSVVGVLITVGVYGVVAAIVKMDDVGLWLTRRRASLSQQVGHGLLWFAPWLMRTLSVVGTLAMFLVGGGIVIHGLPALDHLLVSALADAGAWAAVLKLALTGLLAFVWGTAWVLVVQAMGAIRGLIRR